MTCEHKIFAGIIGVTRLTQSEGGPVTGYTADIRVQCSQCGKPFQFLGLQPGSDSQGARCSLDGLEARLAIAPEGETPNPFQRLSYNVKAFDG